MCVFACLVMFWTAWEVWLLTLHGTVPQLKYVCVCVYMCVRQRERPLNTSLLIRMFFFYSIIQIFQSTKMGQELTCNPISFLASL